MLVWPPGWRTLFICCSQLLIQYINRHSISGGHLHPQTENVPNHCDGPTYHGCCDSLVGISVFHFLNCIVMVIYIIWFSVWLFCFSVSVAVCDAVRFEFFVCMAQQIGCIQAVNIVIVQLFYVCVYVCDLYCTVCIWNFDTVYVNPIPTCSWILEL